MIATMPNLGTVLIVDDTPGNLALLSDTLSEACYRVLVATDGASAIEQIQYIKPDIILLDVMMPGIDGFETCNRIKANPDTESIPILFMTGLSELDHLLRGFHEGALDYIVKPIRPAEVLVRIEVHLTQTRNLHRAESILIDSEFAALSIDSTGCIDWMTPAANLWLLDFLKSQPHLSACQLGDLIPAPLLLWFQSWREQKAEAIYTSSNQALTASISTCQHPNKYLIQLHRNETANSWDAEELKQKLKLTFREAEILMWISRGKTNKEIGLILNTSPRTVNKHLEHIFEKLGVSTRAAAVTKAIQTENR
ncbi:response regulator transcription factor [Methylomonas sp. AM2-LC]|uniref:response regulator transcription factor n=1 Tax=Methylomonas sp. AM2-LC TaxID=3153301 RepID=UPI003266C71B